jgi:hypothetical protein
MYETIDITIITSSTYGKQFDIIFVGSQIPSGVNYRGYVRVGNKTYLIANLNNPRTGGIGGGGHNSPGGGSVINYATQHNYFARGRTNNSGLFLEYFTQTIIICMCHQAT